MENSIKKNITTILSVSIIVKTLGIFYRLICTRFLGFEGMSYLSLINPILNLSISLSSLSIPLLVNQTVANNLRWEKYYNRPFILKSFKLTLISTLIVSIFILLSSWPISHYVYKCDGIFIPIILIIPIIIFSNISAIIKSYFDAHNLFRVSQISNLIEQIIKISLVFLSMIILHNKPLNTLVITIVIILIFCEIASFTYLLFKLKKITPLTLTSVESNEKIMKRAIPLTISHIISSLTMFLEPILLYYSLSKIGVSNKETLFFYTLLNYYAIPLLLMGYLITNGITKAFFPKFCQTNNHKELNTLFEKAFIFSFIVGIISFNICFFFYNEALTIMYSDTSSGLIVKKLSPYFFIFFFNPLLLSIMNSQRMEKEILLNNVIEEMILIISILTFCRIEKFGLNGLLIALVLSNITYFLLNYITLYKKINLKVNYKKILLGLILIIINYTLTKLIKNNNLIMSFLLPNSISVLLIYLYYRTRFQ